MCSEEKLLKQIISKVSSVKVGRTGYYNFGFEYFGPFLYGYTSWLYNSIQKEQFEKVFFFSRDGYMMEKAFKSFNVNNEVKSTYVYFSRKSIRQALLNRCLTYEESLKYITWERYISLGKILEYYGFSAEERCTISEKYNLQLETEYPYNNLMTDKTLKNLYSLLKSDIDKKSLDQENLLRDYLAQIDMNGKCAIVDIGWHGSMQFYLEEFIRIHSMNVSLTGYYVGINPNDSLRGKTEGYLYSAKDLKLRKSVLCFLGGYEKLFQSCEGSTYGYIKKDNHIFPDLAEYEYDNNDKLISSIRDCQQGAMDFLSEIVKENIAFSDEKVWAYPLIEFGKNPSNKGVKLFSFFYNMDGTKTYFVSQKPIYKYKPREFVHALSNSVWKTGFMKSVFKLPLPYYRIYRMMRK